MHDWKDVVDWVA